MKVPFAEKVGYSLGDGAANLVFQLMMMFQLMFYTDVLGIGEPKQELLDETVEALIEERQAARKAKNYARADEIRATLAAQGILLEDTKDGVKWKRA